MALKLDIRGMVHEYPDVFVVGREKVREYAKAVKNDDAAFYDEQVAAELGHDTLPAPLTFVSILALLVQQDFFRTYDVGMETMQIVQVDQKFLFHKPIKAGDRLHARMEVHSVDERFGADIVVTRNVLTDDNGEMLLESYTTLMGHEGENSISMKWDAESGQMMRKAVGE